MWYTRFTFRFCNRPKEMCWYVWIRQNSGRPMSLEANKSHQRETPKPTEVQKGKPPKCTQTQFQYKTQSPTPVQIAKTDIKDSASSSKIKTDGRPSRNKIQQQKATAERANALKRIDQSNKSSRTPGMAKSPKTCKKKESQKKSKEVEKGRHARSGEESRPSKTALKGR